MVKNIYDKDRKVIGTVEEKKKYNDSGPKDFLGILAFFLFFMIGPFFLSYYTKKAGWSLRNHYYSIIIGILIVAFMVSTEESGGMGGKPFLLVLLSSIFNIIAIFISSKEIFKSLKYK